MLRNKIEMTPVSMSPAYDFMWIYWFDSMPFLVAEFLASCKLQINQQQIIITIYLYFAQVQSVSSVSVSDWNNKMFIYTAHVVNGIECCEPKKLLRFSSREI